MSCSLLLNIFVQILFITCLRGNFVFPENELKTGDLCQFNENINGICTEHCQQTEDDFENFGITPTLCSFSETKIIVCCPDNAHHNQTEPQVLMNRSNQNNKKLTPKHNRKSNATPSYREFNSCPYNDTITGICRQQCPDLKFPNYKLLITEKKSCPVERGPPLECCVNHLQIAYSPAIFNLSKDYEEGDFCPFNDTFIGICENACKDRYDFFRRGTFHRQNPICNYQLDGTPIYCCSEYLQSYPKTEEVVPYAIDGDICMSETSKYGFCKTTCEKLKHRSGKNSTTCPHKPGEKPLHCCPALDYRGEVEKFKIASGGRIFYKMCQEYITKNQAHRVKRRIHDKNPQHHLAGAWPIIYGSYPHMAAIGWTNIDGTIAWNCGGTLISDNFVLTAAHCSIANRVHPDIIRIGDQYLDKIEDPNNLPQDFGIEKIIKHPEYSHFATYNDIALIKLNQSITPTAIVYPACLWNDNDDVDDELRSIAIGYGSTEYGGTNSRELLYITLQRFDHEECVNIYNGYDIPSRLKKGILDTQVCANDPTGRQDTCQGDSGGPLEYLINDVHYVYGITSFGQSCPSTVPGVYTKISKYLDWIESIVWPNKWSSLST